MSGVYIIKCVPTGELYVGATKREYEQRVAQHVKLLRNNKHHINLMQKRWNEHGAEAFRFALVQEFPPEEVHTREREAIAALSPAFNLSSAPVGRPRGSGYAAIHAVGDVNLSIHQIAECAGMTVHAVRARLKRGLSGEQLLAPKHKSKRKPYTRRS